MTGGSERLWRRGCAAAVVVALSLCVSCGEDSPVARPDDTSSSSVDSGEPTIDASMGFDAAEGDAAGAEAGEVQETRPHPIVLAHGFAGFDHLADEDGLEYYYGVEAHLEETGRTVWVTEVAPYADSITRGEQLLEQIESKLDDSEHKQVDIIAHSQGGLDARWVAHERPDLVAAVVTISSPHGGTKITDIALDFIDYPGSREVVNSLSELLGKSLYTQGGEETDAVKAARQMSSKGIETFNEKFPNRDGVYYASLAGRTDNQLGKDECNPEESPEFTRKWQWNYDPVDPVLAGTEEILDGEGAPIHPNDGMVRVSKSKWGDFWGCIPADHLDEIGQIAGDKPGGGNSWRHLPFFRDLVAHLRQVPH